MAKRPLPVSHLGEGNDISVEGKITRLSPMKKSRSTQNEYFDGFLSDSKTSLRLVGFNEQKRSRLEHFYNDDTPVLINNCAAETSKMNNELQIIINSTSEIKASPTKFEAVVDNDIKLEQLPWLHKYWQVNFDAKVMIVKEPTTVGKLKTEVQDIILSDPTGVAKMTLWPPHIGSLQEGQSYHFNNIAVNEFNGKKYLVYGQNASKHPIGTIPEVVSPPSEQENQAHDCEVIAVTNLKRTVVCISCKGSVLALKPNIGKCQKCGTIQKNKSCSSRMSAHVFLTAKEFRKKAFNLYSHHLCTITMKDDEDDDDEITEEDILCARPFNIKWVEDNVVSITR